MTPSGTFAATVAPRENIDTRFGTFAGRSGDAITLVEALPGFDGCRRFLLLTSPSIEPLICLQGIDGERPAFLAIDPRAVDPEYVCQLDDLQRQRLAASPDTALLWLAIVCVPDSGNATANLRAPLVINPERMRGLQLLAGHDRYAVDHPLG
jgi:flagellar assembly factor FliW